MVAQDRPRLGGGQVVVRQRPVEGVALRAPEHVTPDGVSAARVVSIAVVAAGEVEQATDDSGEEFVGRPSGGAVHASRAAGPSCELSGYRELVERIVHEGFSDLLVGSRWGPSWLAPRLGPLPTTRSSFCVTSRVPSFRSPPPSGRSLLWAVTIGAARRGRVNELA